MKLNRSKPALFVAAFGLLAWYSGSSARADYPSTVLSQSPAGYWRLNETTPPPQAVATNLGSLGDTANGALFNDVVRGVPGALSGSADTAYGFSNPGWVITYLGSHADVPNNAALNPNGPFTLELWAKPSSAAPDLFCPICSLEPNLNANTSREGYLVYYDGATGKWNFRMGNATGYAGSIEGGTVTPGAWHHVVCVYNGSAMTLYVNGAQVATLVINPSTYTPNSTQPLRIGATTIPNRTWDGSVDEVAFYGSALSAATIAAHFSAAATNGAGYATQILASSPLGYWRLGEPTDPVAANLGTLGSAANGRYAYDAHPGAAGAVPPAYPGLGAGNKAVAFDAGGGNVAVPPLNLNTDAVTITCWVKATGIQPASAGLVLCDSGNTIAGLIIDPVVGGLGLGYAWGGDPTALNWSPSSASALPNLADSDWSFAALVVRPSQAAIYICDRTNFANFAGATNAPPAGHGKQPFDGATLFGLDAAVPGNAFVGSMDEVAIFRRALSVGEVYSQYASALGNVPPRIFGGPEAPANPPFTGDTLRLTVDAGGTPTLSYQWRKNGGALAGATTSVYSKANLIAGDAGTYDCVITNLSGSVTSGGAVIALNTPTGPALVIPPISRTLYPGGTLNLTVVATGGGLHYQWSKNGSPISGATGSAYVIGRVGINDSGSYNVSVNNSAGSVSATAAAITVRSAGAGYEAAIVADGPVSWWRLDESSGTNMWDSMGRHDGTYTNASGSPVTLGATGAITGSSDTAVTFNAASTSYGIVPFSHELNTPTFSIECWAKATDTAGTRVAVGSRSDGPGGYWFWTAPGGAAWSGGIGSGGAQFYVPTMLASLSNVVAGAWTHLVLTYEAASNPTFPMRFYIDGQWDGFVWAPLGRNFEWPFTIGALSGYGSPTAPDVQGVWSGQVDEVLYYDHAISLAQANNHYFLATQGAPKLRAVRTSTNTVVLAWPSSFAGFGLQQNASLNTVNWTNVPNTVTVVGSENQVVISSPVNNRFYRLFHP